MTGVVGNVGTIGIVAIGRNEGERLRACLTSALRDATHVVYVDSGSTDDSVAMARSLGVEVVQLDVSIPFTAARSRNSGFEKLTQIAPEIEFVQFVDGDCEIVAGWIEHAVNEMNAKPQAAVVCGRRRERFPKASIYNKLCDIEWNTPIGQARACGGDAMMRVKAFREVGGYNPEIIAGEEPEMCVRLRQTGYQIWRIDAEMTLHDAAMTRFGQWWKRSVRAGHAYAEGYTLHGQPPERHNAQQVRSILFWGLILPVILIGDTAALSFAVPRMAWIPAVLALLYPLMAVKIAIYKSRQGVGTNDSILYAISVVLGKFPQLLGMLKFRMSRLRGKRTALIEYKSGGVTAPAVTK